jgi:hypothetical protein
MDSARRFCQVPKGRFTEYSSHFLGSFPFAYRLFSTPGQGLVRLNHAAEEITPVSPVEPLFLYLHQFFACVAIDLRFGYVHECYLPGFLKNGCQRPGCCLPTQENAT